MSDLDDYPVVTENSESFLNHRQLLDYRSEREDCLQWLLTYGKEPDKGELWEVTEPMTDILWSAVGKIPCFEVFTAASAERRARGHHFMSSRAGESSGCQAPRDEFEASRHDSHPDGVKKRTV